MTHGSLFSGIGGFDLSAEWMGWENKFHCEINPFCKRVLNYYWPDAKSYDDIKTTGFTVWRGKIDILTGGFPCQPYSAAGKRLGKEDDRHLWPEMLRAIREIQPRWIVGENVRGLTNWNGGMVFDEVQADLEAEGYEVLPFLLPACAVNAPHRRDRIWFIAHPVSNGRSEYPGCLGDEAGQDKGQVWVEVLNAVKPNGETRATPNTVSEEQREQAIGGLRAESWSGNKGNDVAYANGGERKSGLSSRKSKDKTETRTRLDNRLTRFSNNGTKAWECFPTQPPVCSGDDELPRKLDGITFSKWRNESIKGYGNAVVPQLVYEIFKAIEQYEKNV